MDYPKSLPNAGLVGGKFVDEDQVTGTPGSLIPSAWGNAVTDELLTVILSAGLTPNEGDKTQLLQAIQAITASDVKQSVRVATTGPIALSGLQTIDGIALAAGARVLVKDQASAAQNGIYVSAAAAWVRAQDANDNAEFSPGFIVIVQAGTQHGGGIWQFKNQAFPTVGTTSLAFGLLLGKTGVVAGDYHRVTVDAQGRVTGGSNPTTLAGYGINDAPTTTQMNTAIAFALTALLPKRGFAENDFIRIPDVIGGLVIQMGTVLVGPEATVDVTLPLTFNTGRGALAGITASAATNQGNFAAYAKLASNSVVKVTQDVNSTTAGVNQYINWIAWGY